MDLKILTEEQLADPVEVNKQLKALRETGTLAWLEKDLKTEYKKVAEHCKKVRKQNWENRKVSASGSIQGVTEDVSQTRRNGD